MDMLRCYNSLYLRRKYELNKNKKNDNTVCRVRSSKYPGFPYSPLYYDSVNAMEDNIEKCRDFRYILETYSDIHENNSIVFSSIYMSSSLIADDNKLKPEMLSCYRFELERIEEYIKKCNNKYKYDDEYKKYIKYNSIANKYPAFPNIFSMQFHKNGKEVIEDN